MDTTYSPPGDEAARMSRRRRRGTSRISTGYHDETEHGDEEDDHQERTRGGLQKTSSAEFEEPEVDSIDMGHGGDAVREEEDVHLRGRSEEEQDLDNNAAGGAGRPWRRGAAAGTSSTRSSTSERHQRTRKDDDTTSVIEDSSYRWRLSPFLPVGGPPSPSAMSSSAAMSIRGGGGGGVMRLGATTSTSRSEHDATTAGRIVVDDFEQLHSSSPSQLSTDERELILYDIHGVSSPADRQRLLHVQDYEKDPEALKLLVDQMKSQLDDKTRNTLRTTRTSILLFLRAEDYDVAKSIARLRRYEDWFQAMFRRPVHGATDSTFAAGGSIADNKKNRGGFSKTKGDMEDRGGSGGQQQHHDESSSSSLRYASRDDKNHKIFDHPEHQQDGRTRWPEEDGGDEEKLAFEEWLQVVDHSSVLASLTSVFLDEVEINYLRLGFCQWLPSRDRSGRAIMLISKNVMERQEVDLKIKQKIIWFIVMKAIENDALTQQRGVVLLFFAFQQDHDTAQAATEQDSSPPSRTKRTSDESEGASKQEQGHETLQLTRLIAQILPIRLVAIHICFNSESVRPFLDLAASSVDLSTQVRARYHCGTWNEIQNELATYGIPASIIPMSSEGVVQVDYHEAWIDTFLSPDNVTSRDSERQEEEASSSIIGTTRSSSPPSPAGAAIPPNSPGGGTTAASSSPVKATSSVLEDDAAKAPHDHAIKQRRSDEQPPKRRGGSSVAFGLSQQGTVKSERREEEQPSNNPATCIPTDLDVLMGAARRSKSIDESPGNQRLKQLLEETASKYNEAGSQFEKTVVSQSVVATVREYGGRFLKQDLAANGVLIWVEVDEESARKKVSHAFRNLRRGSSAASTSQKGRRTRGGGGGTTSSVLVSTSRGSSVSSASPLSTQITTASASSSEQQQKVPSAEIAKGDGRSVMGPFSPSSDHRPASDNELRLAMAAIIDYAAAQNEDHQQIPAEGFGIPTAQAARSIGTSGGVQAFHNQGEPQDVFFGVSSSSLEPRAMSPGGHVLSQENEQLFLSSSFFSGGGENAVADTSGRSQDDEDDDSL